MTTVIPCFDIGDTHTPPGFSRWMLIVGKETITAHDGAVSAEAEREQYFYSLEGRPESSIMERLSDSNKSGLM